MAKILVMFYSRGGATAEMARHVVEGALTVPGVEVTLKPVAEVEPKGLVAYDGLICGSPTYYGLMAGEIKTFFDKTVAVHGLLENKVGGSQFTSAGNLAGGNETTLIGILEMMLIHGMVVKGTHQRDHYGPVAIGAPDERAIGECRKLGKNVATLAVKLHGVTHATDLGLNGNGITTQQGDAVGRRPTAHGR